jgi:UDP-N-acetylmuramate-alanine ligase
LDADQVIVLDVYAARETKPEGFSITDVVKKIKGTDVNFLPTKEQALEYLINEMREGDLLLIFTAGDAIEINQQLEQILSR